MAKRTQIVCLHEGRKGRSIDPVFINGLLKSLKPAWIRPWGSNIVRTVGCDGRKSLIERTPAELRAVLSMGGNTTLMVWADVDDDVETPMDLKEMFWTRAQEHDIPREAFDQIVFAFAKDRLENWIQYLLTGSTDESEEGPRARNNRAVRDAAKILADRCRRQQFEPPLPPSMQWSCHNWRALVERMSGN